MVGLMLYLATDCVISLHRSRGLSAGVSPFHPTCWPFGRATTQLDLSGLDAAVQVLFSADLASLMQAAYCRRFLLFCGTCHVTQPFPASERVLSGFVAHLHKAGLAPGTVKIYLTAVCHSQIVLGLGEPYLGNMSMLDYVIKGLKQSYQPGFTWTRLPMTLPILRGLRVVWSENAEHHNVSMLWAASSMYFFGFLRVGEIVVPSDSHFDPSSQLAFGDVHVNNVVTPHYLEVRIKASKTDPFGRECQCALVRLGGMYAQWLLFSATWRSGDMIRVPDSDYPTELALLGTDLSLQCSQLWTALDTTLLFTRTIASVSVKLPPWLSVGYRTL